MLVGQSSPRYARDVNIHEQLATLPPKPGIYLFKDAQGNILYVGKAKKLTARVRSYFRESANLDPAKQPMVPHIRNIETITTDTEVEALILEANLIRQHQPPYNVVLRDDKYYLFIKITTPEEFPRVFPVRRVKRDGARYFGPYSSAQSVRSTLRLLRRLFPHREEKKSPREKIFPHPLFTTPENDYPQNIQNIIRFLSGKRNEIMQTLRAGMQQAAREHHYERAATFRDQLQAIERLEGTQKVFLPRQETFDVVSLARTSGKSAANVLQIRAGKLLGKQTFLLQHRAQTSVADTLRQFILQYYSVAQDIPKNILIPELLNDQETLARWIDAEHPPAFSVPERGQKKQLLIMGESNAAQLLTQAEANVQTDPRVKQALAQLAQAIGLGKKLLKRIETYDISNIQGQLATASMIVFADGKPQRSQYRKFKIKITGQPNDFAMLQETLARRFSGRHENWKTPDLIMIDGGKGQLSAAKKILDELFVRASVIALAKREEEIFKPNQKDPIRLPYDSDALYLIQRMRDEAHRFTISYHRLLRSKRSTRSMLDDIPGIGPKTKKQLLRHFRSVKNLRAAAPQELEKVIGQAKMAVLQDYL